MFKNSSKVKETFNQENKIDNKVSQDFVTHNMPESHRFSGQTFSGQTSGRNDQAIKLSGAESHHKIGLLIIGGGLILVGALFYFGYAYFIKPYLSQSVVSPSNNTQATETPVIVTPTLEATTPVETIATETPLISTSTNDLVASSSDPLFPEDTQIVTTTVEISTVDSDADGLTDVEEKIAGTDPNKADSDSDGYLDLAELKSGYDPLVPGAKVSENSKMLNYQIDPKATIVYPSSWDITRSDINSTVIFADSDKAFIQVVYQDNPGKIKPSVWFTQQFSGLLPGEAISGESWQGFYSQDGLAAYVFNKDLSKVYSFSCSPLVAGTNSVSLFHLMIKTLIIK